MWVSKLVQIDLVSIFQGMILYKVALDFLLIRRVPEPDVIVFLDEFLQRPFIPSIFNVVPVDVLKKTVPFYLLQP